MSDNAIPQTGQQRERENNKETQQDKTPRGPLQTSHGVTTIEENVVAKIAGMATREVPGVYDMGNAVRRAFSAVTDRIPNAQTNVAGGISVQKGEIPGGRRCHRRGRIWSLHCGSSQCYPPQHYRTD